MGILSGIFKARDKPENRTAGSAYTFYMGGSTSGKNVTERSAMQMTAVYSYVRILAEAVAGLPLYLYKYTAEGCKEKAIDHTLTISVGVNGVQFYGFRVCTDFSEEPTAGEAEYTLGPRKFKDVNGDMVGPATGVKLTLEMLRRKPDSALVWYEDFCDEEKIPESYWTVLSGEWDVWQDPDSTANRPYS